VCATCAASATASASRKCSAFSWRNPATVPTSSPLASQTPSGLYASGARRSLNRTHNHGHVSKPKPWRGCLIASLRGCIRVHAQRAWRQYNDPSCLTQNTLEHLQGPYIKVHASGHRGSIVFTSAAWNE
jgi:hypothetical protein